VALLVWLLWAWCSVDVARSALTQLRRHELLSDAPRTIDRVAARVAGLAMLVMTVLPGFTTSAGASVSTTTLRVPSVVASTILAPPAPPIPSQRTYAVQDGDCLWSIAQDLYGDPLDWTVIAKANLGHVMGDGRLFHDPSLIFAGWKLDIPHLPSAMPSATNASPLPSLLPIHTHTPEAEGNQSLGTPPARGAATTKSPPTLATHSTLPQTWWLPTGIASSALLLGLVLRRQRRAGAVLASDALIDAVAIIEEYPVEPLVTLLERSILLASRDGVLTAASLMTINPEGAQLRRGADLIWTATPADLSAPCRPPTTSPGFVLPLSDAGGCSEVLIVPRGTTSTLMGASATRIMSEAMALQREFLWGMWNHLEDSEQPCDPDQLALLTRLGGDRDEDAAYILVVDHGGDIDLDQYASSGQEDQGDRAPLAMFDTLGQALLNAPTSSATMPAPLSVTIEADHHGPLLRLLTPEPRIDGLAQTIEPSRQRRVIELIAYLCLHRDHAPNADRLRTRLLGTTQRDAAAKTLFNITSAARRALGTSPDGKHHLPAVTRDGRYEIASSVHSDIEYFFSWTAPTHVSPEQRLDDLRRAFELIEGEPLSARLSGYHWLSAEGLRASLEVCVETAAREGVALALASGSLGLADAMVAKARCVASYSEELCILAMRVAAARCSESGLRSAFEALGQVRDQLDPGSEPDIHHEQVYRSLLERIRADQASLAAIEAAPRSTRPSAPAAL
jgi:DNA-binding SARP family transcriptional activator